MLYDLQPPYAVIAGFPEYKTGQSTADSVYFQIEALSFQRCGSFLSDYMQFGNYPVDEMAFVRSCRQEPLACGVGRNGLDY